MSWFETKSFGSFGPASSNASAASSNVSEPVQVQVQVQVPASTDVITQKNEMREECESKAAKQAILQRAPRRGLVFILWNVDRHLVQGAWKIPVSNDALVQLYEHSASTLCQELLHNQTIPLEFRTPLLADPNRQYHCGVSMAVAELRAALLTKLQQKPFPLSMSGMERVAAIMQEATPFIGVSVLLTKHHARAPSAHSWLYTE
jgi:hypothetical protein